MADDPSTSAGKHHHGVSKFLSSRWRSKSNADQSLPAANVDQNVADFLRPSATARSRSFAPVTPRIDIAAAQQWTANAAGNGMSTPSSLRGRGGSQKKPRKPNLTVNFSTTNEIIGEGGDECEFPTMEISARKKGNPALARSATHREGSSRVFESPPRPQRSMTHNDADESLPVFGGNEETDESRAAAYRQLFGEEPQPLKQQSEDNFVPQPLKRAPTGARNVSNSSQGRESLSSAYSEDSVAHSPIRQRKPTLANPYGLPEMKSLVDDSPIDLYLKFGENDQNDDSMSANTPESQDRIQRMRQEEGRVLHRNARMSIVELAEEDLSKLSLATGPSPQPPQPMSQPPPHPQSQPSQPSYPPRSIPPAFATSNAAQGQGFKPYSPVDGPKPIPSSSTPTSAKPYTPVAASYQPASATLSNQPSLRESRTADVLQRSNPSVRKPVMPGYAVPMGPAQSSNQMSAGKPSPAPLTIPQQEVVRNESRQSESRQSERGDYRTPATATSLKTPSSALSQAAYEDFSRRCEHMRGIFRLQAEFEKPMTEYSATQWLRAAAWWLVKGRAGMEAFIRSRQRPVDGQPPGTARPEQLTQPHVDLAKCWWILAEVIPFHQSLPSSNITAFSTRAASAVASNDSVLAEFFESCELLQGNLKALISSMSRNQAMPPPNALIQGQDQSIWVQYAQFPSDMLPILSGAKRSITGTSTVQKFDPLSVMAVTDTKRDFAYYRWFVQASIQPEENEAERVTLLCLFSVMRTRNDWHPKVTVCTQKELLSICVTGDRKLGPSWEDVKWSQQDFCLQIKLAQGYILNVQLTQQDYMILASLYKKAFAVQTSLFPLEGEQVLFEVPLEDFQYNDTMRPPAFPLERMRRCRIRLFIRFEEKSDATGGRSLYRGLRLLVVSSPKNRTLAHASHEIGFCDPVIIENLTENMGTENFPAMALHIKEEHRSCSLFMVFSQLRERESLCNAINEAELAPHEMQYASLRLKKMGVEPTVDSEEYEKAGDNPLSRIHWAELTVINKDPHNPDDDFGEVIGSDALRIISVAPGATVTDRINLGKHLHLACLA
jgi:hypothetical protein